MASRCTQCPVTLMDKNEENEMVAKNIPRIIVIIYE